MRLAFVLALAGCAGDPTCAPGDDTLGGIARGQCMHAGTFLFGSDGAPPEYFAALHEFDLITVPIFVNLVEPARDQWDFSLADAVIDNAPPTTLFYVPGFSNDNLPDWLTAVAPAEREQIMTTYIRTVMTHIQAKAPGRVIAWEVVLEPMSWDNRFGFWTQIGSDKYDYIRIAYRTARATIPDAKLYTDDFWIEDGGDRTDRLFALVGKLRDEGVPLDGIGFEGHFMLGNSTTFRDVPSREVLVENLERFGALGYETMYTSIDVSMRDGEVALDAQADAYRRLIDACMAAPSCAAFSTWGVGDPDSWIPQQYSGWGTPLMFDSHYARKPAYDAVRAGFQASR